MALQQLGHGVREESTLRSPDAVDLQLSLKDVTPAASPGTNVINGSKDICRRHPAPPPLATLSSRFARQPRRRQRRVRRGPLRYRNQVAGCQLGMVVEGRGEDLPFPDAAFTAVLSFTCCTKSTPWPTRTQCSGTRNGCCDRVESSPGRTASPVRVCANSSSTTSTHRLTHTGCRTGWWRRVHRRQSRHPPRGQVVLVLRAARLTHTGEEGAEPAGGACDAPGAGRHRKVQGVDNSTSGQTRGGDEGPVFGQGMVWKAAGGQIGGQTAP